MIRLLFAPLAAAIVTLGEVGYLICVATGAVRPEIFGMNAYTPTLFSGFTRIDAGSIVLGSVEVALYGLAAAAVATLAWNNVVDRAAMEAG